MNIVLIIPLANPITLPEARPAAKQTLSRNMIPRSHFLARTIGIVSPTAPASLPMALHLPAWGSSEGGSEGSRQQWVVLGASGL